MHFAQWSFDELALKREYANALRKSVDLAVKEFHNYHMVKKYFDESDAPLYEEENDGLTLTVTLTANHLRAWLENWGTGQSMRADNPDLENYVEGNYFAHNEYIRDKRFDYGRGIVYRGAGKYTRPDYRRGYGTITAEGSEPAGRPTRAYRGQRGQQFTNNAWYFAKIRQEKIFQNYLSSINPYDFIIVSQEVM